MRILLFGFLIITSTLFIQTSRASEFQFSNTSAKGLMQAYGFILGQEYSLSNIDSDFPELAGGVALARAEFNSSFPSIKEKIREQFTAAIGQDSFDQIEQEIINQLHNTLGIQKLSREDAQNFLLIIRERADGEIETPVLEYILTILYLDSPANEFIDGYRQRFSSKDHPKALGIDLTLQVPRSWKGQEGERPHIVQKWKSQYGAGSQLIILDVRDTQGYTPTGADIKSSITSGEVKEFLPDGSEYVDAGLFSVEKSKGQWIEYTQREERVGVHLYQHILLNQVYFQGKAIGIMCSSVGLEEDRAKVDLGYRDLRPMCQQVLNSLVLLQAY